MGKKSGLVLGSDNVKYGDCEIFTETDIIERMKLTVDRNGSKMV